MPRQSTVQTTLPNDSVLLLGMVFAHSATEPKRGQEFRDRVRCEAVNKLGYQVYTLDDKHSDLDILEHCDANFADPRRMVKRMKTRWTESIKFQHIILDYFFSPVGWARSRWTQRFFYKTIPAFVQEGILPKDGMLWLPNLDCITKEIEEYSEIIQAYYKVELVDECDQNPLYRATDDVTEELLRCPDNLTNANQIQPLYNHSKYPFVRLTVRDPSSSSAAAAVHERLPWQPIQPAKTLKSIPVLPYDSSTPSSSPIKRRRVPVAVTTTSRSTRAAVNKKKGSVQRGAGSSSGGTDEEEAEDSLSTSSGGQDSDDLLQLEDVQEAVVLLGTRASKRKRTTVTL